MKLENFGDLFKYNKELFDDDFNAGQKVVIKAKTKSQDGCTVSIQIRESNNKIIGIHKYLQARCS